MAVVLGLVSAALFGSGDFFGAMAAKRSPVLQVVAVSHFIGLIGIGVAAAFIATTPITRDLLLGSIGGLSGLVGIALLYRLLSVGPMSVIAPLTALTSAAVPAVWGVVDGERFSQRGWIGIVLALVAVGLASAEIGGTSQLDTDEPESELENESDAEQPVTLRVVLESLLAGAGFGGFFIILDSTSSTSGPWTIVAARVTTTVVLVAASVALTKIRLPLTPAGGPAGRNGSEQVAPGGVLGGAGTLVGQPNVVFRPITAVGLALLVGAGVADTFANLAFLYATQLGDLTLVSVLAALYPSPRWV